MVTVGRHGPSPFSAICLLSTYRNSQASGKLRRLFHQQLRPHICLLTRELSQTRHHQREPSSRLNTGLKSPICTQIAPPGGRSGSLPALKSKSVDTSQNIGTPPENSSVFEIAAGMRVRLRDTGRLGTVVGKKAGGWWIVDVLENWGSTGTKKAPRSSSKVRGDRHGNGNSSKAVRKRGATKQTSTIASGEPVSTRRGNMEPLGAAYYALPENASQLTVGEATSGNRRRANWSNRRKSESPQQEVEEEGDRLDVGVDPDSAGRESVRKRAMKKSVAALVPPMLLGETISVDVAAENAADTVAIRAISSDGLLHGQMKEWLVFSDLHVSSDSLLVSLEVGSVQQNY